MPETTYFEVRCERCKTSFAPGTRTCVHCGGPIGRRFLRLDPTRTSAEEILAEAPGAPEAPSSGNRVASFIRIAMIGLVLISAFARACME
jgi:hypothetical protein